MGNHYIITGKYVDGEHFTVAEPVASADEAYEIARGMNAAAAAKDHDSFEDEVGRKFHITAPVLVCDCDRA